MNHSAVSEKDRMPFIRILLLETVFTCLPRVQVLVVQQCEFFI
jgi:hypothetical protein